MKKVNSLQLLTIGLLLCITPVVYENIKAVTPISRASIVSYVIGILIILRAVYLAGKNR